MKSITFFSYADTLVRRKRKAGKYSTADLYRASSNWFRQYWIKDTLSFAEISPGLIDCFLAWLQTSSRLKTNSINSYMSSLRAIYNTAVREGLAPASNLSPFAHLNFREEETAKRAISMDILEEIACLDVSNDPALQKAKDLSLFSFLACGIPFVDLAHLTHKNILGNELVYNRIKTGNLVRIHITDGMQRLLDEYATCGSTYLFPILPEDRSGKQLHEAYKHALFCYNSNLVDIGNRLTIPIHLTSYVFRHTWATEALHNDIPVAVISQALGHTSEKTTRHYLDLLDQSKLDAANNLITKRVDGLIGRRA